MVVANASPDQPLALEAFIGQPTRSFTATNLESGRTYYAVVRAVDWAGNEGPASAEVSATPGP